MKTARQLNILLAALFVLIFATVHFAQAAQYTLTVNSGTKIGSWNRFYEKMVASDHMYTVISSAYGRNISNALKKAHDEAGIQYVRGHGIFDDDVAVYKEDASGNAVYSWTNLDKIYDSVVAAGMRPFVELGFMPNALASAQTHINNVWYNNVGGNWNAPKDWNKWKAFIQAFIAHLETRYGQAEVRNNWFFELWNEPNWMYGGGGGDNGYLRLYDSTAVAFSAQDSLVKLGGPAENGGASQSFIATLIQHCKTYKRKLDFVTYHNYANDNAGEGQAPGMLTYHQRIKDVCKNNGFTGLVMCTEWGPTYTQGSLIHDNEMGASFAVKVINFLNSTDTLTYQPPYGYGWWALSDIYEETNNTGSSPAFAGCYGLLCRGVASIPQSWDVAKPAFNAYKMLHKLGAYRLQSNGGTTASPGINALATISAANDTVCILVFSHVDNTTGNSALMDTVTLSLSNLPFGSDSIRVEHFVVDRNHSNSYQTWVGLGKPANPTAAQWTTISNASQLAHYDSVTTTITTGGAFTKKFTQNYYSLGLIIITKAKPATAIKNSAEKAGENVLNSTIIANVLNRKANITMPYEGEYAIQLYTTNGCKVMDVKEYGPGNTTVSLEKLPAGFYILHCVSRVKSLEVPVFLGR